MKQQLRRSPITFIFFLCLAAGFNSCKKDANHQDDDDDNNGGGGFVKITGYAPQKPMWGEVIEITGEGFASNVGDVEVWFPGIVTNKKEITGEVLETSPTKMKVRIPYNTQKKSDGYEYPTMNNPSSSIVVKVKGKNEYSTESHYVHYKAVPFIQSGNGVKPYGYSGVAVRPGTKIMIEGRGFGLTKTEGKLRINGKEATIDSIWGNVPSVFGEGNTKLIATMPLELTNFGVGDVQDYEYEYSRQGRSYARTYRGYATPPMPSIYNNTLKLRYYKNDHVTDFTMTGTNLFPSQILYKNRADGPDFTVAVTGAAIGATSVTSFVPLAQMLPLGFSSFDVYYYEPAIKRSYMIQSGVAARIEIYPHDKP